MNPILKVILQVLGGAIGFALACVIGIWAFAHFPTISWYAFGIILVVVAVQLVAGWGWILPKKDRQ